MNDPKASASNDTDEAKVKESSLNPFLDKAKNQDLKSVVIRNIADDFDARRNLDFIGLRTVPEKSSLLKFSARKVAVGETNYLKLKLKNDFQVSSRNS